jgi:hypothetical protein
LEGLAEIDQLTPDTAHREEIQIVGTAELRAVEQHAEDHHSLVTEALNSHHHSQDTAEPYTEKDVTDTEDVTEGKLKKPRR